MSIVPEKDSARGPEKRVQPFLDCIAYLLAKRWLRDQRQQAETPLGQQVPSDSKAQP